MRQLGILACLYCSIALGAETPPQPLDGVHRTVKDPLLDRMVGSWDLTGKVMGKPTRNQFSAEWVLNHQFLRLHFKAIDPPSNGQPPYEAFVYVGYDNASDRYVAHWIDIFGGRFSETLGFGHQDGTAVKFLFEYPDGPFTNMMTYHPKTDSWTLLLRQKDPAGTWTDFAEETLKRPKKE